MPSHRNRHNRSDSKNHPKPSTAATTTQHKRHSHSIQFILNLALLILTDPKQSQPSFKLLLLRRRRRITPLVRLLHSNPLTDTTYEYHEDNAKCARFRAVDNLINQSIRTSTRSRLEIPRDFIRRGH